VLKSNPTSSQSARNHHLALFFARNDKKMTACSNLFAHLESYSTQILEICVIVNLRRTTQMKMIVKVLAVVTLATALSACNGMTKTQRNTAIGAAVGGVAGHMIGESTGATLGGAALGGVIGSQIK